MVNYATRFFKRKSSFIKINLFNPPIRSFILHYNCFSLRISQSYIQSIRNTKIHDSIIDLSDPFAYRMTQRLYFNLAKRLYSLHSHLYIYKILKSSLRRTNSKVSIVSCGKVARGYGIEAKRRFLDSWPGGRINETEGKLKSIRCIRTFGIPSRYIMYLLSEKQIRRITRGWRRKLDFLDQPMSSSRQSSLLSR